MIGTTNAPTSNPPASMAGVNAIATVPCVTQPIAAPTMPDQVTPIARCRARFAKVLSRCFIEFFSFGEAVLDKRDRGDRTQANAGDSPAQKPLMQGFGGLDCHGYRGRGDGSD